MNNTYYPIFSVYGIELEYMIVDATTLTILPITDLILQEFAGELTTEVDLGEIALNNELALHVIELKTSQPVDSLNQLDQHFLEAIHKVNSSLAKRQALLMPTGAHPWLNPLTGIKLWPHGDRSIYETYHRIFNCEGHGWSNLQSTHINLPFANDEEFAKLHNAIRLLLPLIPALAASTPFIEGRFTGSLDTRLTYYGHNQKKIPLISGEVIPEFVLTKENYINEILFPMYQAIAPFDEEKILQFEWLNSRGAIARFDRQAIEIRIMDIQECPSADVACIAAITEVLRDLVDNSSSYLESPLTSKQLKAIYDQVITHGLNTIITDKSFLDQFKIKQSSITAKALWHHLIERTASKLSKPQQLILESILSHGNLAERLLTTFKNTSQKPEDLKLIYQKLCHCLQSNGLYLP